MRRRECGPRSASRRRVAKGERRSTSLQPNNNRTGFCKRACYVRLSNCKGTFRCSLPDIRPDGMTHSFLNAYSRFEQAVPRLDSTDTIREKLYAISAILATIDDNDFDEALPLRSNFRDIQRRLRRSHGFFVGERARSLDNTSEAMLDELSHEISRFFGAMSSEKYWRLRYPQIQQSDPLRPISGAPAEQRLAAGLTLALDNG